VLCVVLCARLLMMIIIIIIIIIIEAACITGKTNSKVCFFKCLNYSAFKLEEETFGFNPIAWQHNYKLTFAASFQYGAITAKNPRK